MANTRIIWSGQYSLPCVSVENCDLTHPDSVIAECELEQAVRRVDGLEYCVELREDVGPELFTEDALRRSCGKRLKP